ncbi:hypothetical protein RND61_29420 [Streptomyces sp. TRM76323]|uniref:Apolipoprotein N-acyltransferase n=1 Tax=Streptomyces tamarix TaxID=3078565 RepID=A0ABU3QUB5_9ACTN|nr:hypothetical protein [Streptomyces tamarix]MDT9686156.1 hypothetical protein [Streptomyces tamarix]
MNAAANARPRVRGLPRAVVALAVLAALPPLLTGLDTPLGGLFLLTALPVPLPLLLGRYPRAFSWTCFLLGLALCLWVLVGAMAGTALFLPAAVLLLIAPAVGPR